MNLGNTFYHIAIFEYTVAGTIITSFKMIVHVFSFQILFTFLMQL